MHRNLVRINTTANEVLSRSGHRYVFQKMIQDKSHLGRVWVATSEQQNFLLKQMPNEIYSNFSAVIWPRCPKSRFIRTPSDSIPEERILVYPYLDDDFLHLVKYQFPKAAKRTVLKSVLIGLADLHEQDIVHLDIKPDNIMVNHHNTNEGAQVDQVQLIDLENAAHLPKGRCIKGMLAGNENWRSPEAHFRGELSKSTDVFSFAIVCVYAILGRVIFGADEDLQKHEANGALPHLVRLQRQVSYFGSENDLNGLMKHVGDVELNCQVLQMLWEDRTADYIPYKPFADWPDIDENFRDLIQQMTKLDPSKRITARQALEHSWFKDFQFDRTAGLQSISE